MLISSFCPSGALGVFTTAHKNLGWLSGFQFSASSYYTDFNGIVCASRINQCEWTFSCISLAFSSCKGGIDLPVPTIPISTIHATILQLCCKDGWQLLFVLQLFNSFTAQVTCPGWCISSFTLVWMLNSYHYQRNGLSKSDDGLLSILIYHNVILDNYHAWHF